MKLVVTPLEITTVEIRLAKLLPDLTNYSDFIVLHALFPKYITTVVETELGISKHYTYGRLKYESSPYPIIPKLGIFRCPTYRGPSFDFDLEFWCAQAGIGYRLQGNAPAG